MSPATLKRKPKQVFHAEDGRLYQEYVVHRGGKATVQRRYGDYAACERCGTRYFKFAPKSRYCSQKCIDHTGRGKDIPRPKRMTKTSARDKADRLFSLAVRSRGACERCGQTERTQLQCAHIVSRRYLSTRWDWDNAFCLCAPCHWKGTNNPLWWDDFVIGKIGQDAYADLKRRAQVPLHPDIGTYMVVIGCMEKLVEEAGLLSPDDELVTPRILAKRFLEGAP